MPLSPFHLLTTACRQVDADAVTIATITAEVSISGDDGGSYEFTQTGTITATRATMVLETDDLAANEFALTTEDCPTCIPATNVQYRSISGSPLAYIASGTITQIDVYSGVPDTPVTFDVFLYFDLSGTTADLYLQTIGLSDTTKSFTGLNPVTLASMIGTHIVTASGVDYGGGVTADETFTYTIAA